MRPSVLTSYAGHAAMRAQVSGTTFILLLPTISQIVTRQLAGRQTGPHSLTGFCGTKGSPGEAAHAACGSAAGRGRVAGMKERSPYYSFHFEGDNDKRHFAGLAPLPLPERDCRVVTSGVDQRTIAELRAALFKNPAYRFRCFRQPV